MLVGELTSFVVGWLGGVISLIVIFHCTLSSNSPSFAKTFTVFIPQSP